MSRVLASTIREMDIGPLEGLMVGTRPNCDARIVPVSKWLATSIYKPSKGHLEGEQPYLGDLLTMVINYLQVLG